MTDSARRRGLATAGALALKCATDPRPTLDRTDRSHTKITIFRPLNSVRRPAPASRTCGRDAVDPAGSILEPTPHSGAPTSAGGQRSKKITKKNRRLTGPAPSGMNGHNYLIA
jgi:hypothetical protein